MKLPNAEQALVAREKIVRCLLNPDHEEGSSKESFFQRFGFSPNEWERLAFALKQHAQENEAVLSRATPHGDLYTVSGPIEGRDARTPVVTTVWIIDIGSTRPRFVSAYPGRRAR